MYSALLVHVSHVWLRFLHFEFGWQYCFVYWAQCHYRKAERIVKNSAAWTICFTVLALHWSCTSKLATCQLGSNLLVSSLKLTYLPAHRFHAINLIFFQPPFLPFGPLFFASSNFPYSAPPPRDCLRAVSSDSELPAPHSATIFRSDSHSLHPTPVQGSSSWKA